jgi:hypothetical protein
MATKRRFFPFGFFSIKDGTHIRFWEYKLLEDSPIREQYPTLYNIVRHKGVNLSRVMESSSSSVTFTRNLTGLRQASWDALLLCLASTQLTHGPNEFRWNLNENGIN